MKERSAKRLALRLSEIGPTMKDVREHLQYLQDFQDEVSKQKSQSQQSLAQLRIEVGIAPLPLAEQAYEEIEDILTRAIGANKEIFR